jgi:phage gp46-like protein
MSGINLVTLGLMQASGLSLTTEGLLIVQELVATEQPGVNVGGGRKYDIRLVLPGLNGLVLPQPLPTITEEGLGALFQLLTAMQQQAQQLSAISIENDIRVVSGDLESEPTLRSAVLLSLFLDRRVTDEELAEFGLEGDDPRGWWGDAFPTVEGDVYGSKLWLLRRGKQTEQTRARAEAYAREALGWLLEDEIALSVDVAASYPRMGLLGLEVAITKPANPAERYGFVWGA